MSFAATFEKWKSNQREPCKIAKMVEVLEVHEVIFGIIYFQNETIKKLLKYVCCIRVAVKEPAWQLTAAII